MLSYRILYCNLHTTCKFTNQLSIGEVVFQVSFDLVDLDCGFGLQSPAVVIQRRSLLQQIAAFQTQRRPEVPIIFLRHQTCITCINWMITHATHTYIYDEYLAVCPRLLWSCRCGAWTWPPWRPWPCGSIAMQELWWRRTRRPTRPAAPAWWGPWPAPLG